MESYTIRKLSKENVSDLISIYKDAFGQDVSEDFLIRKQQVHFLNQQYVGFIAYDQQKKAAAFYGVYPCLIAYNGQKYLAAQSGDTMTHSAHTGKGLFTKLAIETYSYCKANEFHCVFGFPNENSFPGFVKRLGWSHFDDMIPYLIRVKCIPWIRLKNTFKLPQRMHDWWCDFVLKSTKKGVPFESSSLTTSTPVVDHSTDFFAYKTYGDNYVIQVKGINVWVKFDDTFLFIGDIQKCDEHTFLKTLKGLKKIAFWMGLPHLRFQASSETWGSALFQKYGVAMEVKYPVGGVNFTDEIPLEKLKFTGADNDTF